MPKAGRNGGIFSPPDFPWPARFQRALCQTSKQCHVLKLDQKLRLWPILPLADKGAIRHWALIYSRPNGGNAHFVLIVWKLSRRVSFFEIFCCDKYVSCFFPIQTALIFVPVFSLCTPAFGANGFCGFGRDRWSVDDSWRQWNPTDKPNLVYERSVSSTKKPSCLPAAMVSICFESVVIVEFSWVHV